MIAVPRRLHPPVPVTTLTIAPWSFGLRSVIALLAAIVLLCTVVAGAAALMGGG